MRNFQKFFLIFVLSLFPNTLFAGLDRSTIGPGGFKNDIEVNEIEEIINDTDVNDESTKSIEGIELKKIDSNSIGILSEDQGGLNYKMWEGSERKIIKKYLKNLPINIESNAAITMIKKILLSSAEVPEESNEQDLILIRINKLVELGDFENAKSLIDIVDINSSNEEILMKKTEINLSLNNFDLVCSDIDEKRRSFKKNLFWRKVEVFCQILNNEINRANLSLALLKEDKNFNDDKFLTIIDSLIYKEEIDNQTLDELDLLNLAMTRVANINLKENYNLNAEPLLLSMIYRMPNVPIKLRIEAIEKSKKLLNIPIDIIEEIYNSYEIEEKDKKISLDDNILLGYETQAILYQMANKEDNDETKAKIIKKSLELSIINGNFSLISKLNLNSLLEIEPSKKLFWFAHLATKALLSANKLDEAIEWFEVLEKEKNRNIDVFGNFVELWTIMEFYNLYNKEINYKKVPQEDILKSIDKFQQQEQLVSFDTLGFYILEIFGLKIDPRFWLINLSNQEIENKQLPNSSLISLLKYTSENKRIGETILLILMALDGKNFNEFHPFFLQTAISSLNQIELKENAFDLAIEVLIDR